ncbi:MAG TPA: glycine betaine ABC transporter substrate-binding protein [Solirubrobacteraceae bacterium]|nr:glycine betaine ABC transporter substrate-binding protein [Solirubrobacteraceae bacterium]
MNARRLPTAAGRPLALVAAALALAACGASATTSPSAPASRTSASTPAPGGAPAVRRATSRDGRGGRLAQPAASARTAAGEAQTSTATTTVAPLPGAGHPPIELGDKNYTEQFLLGQLYAQALEAEGYTVTLNQNIGPVSVTMQALRDGSLMAYPEYLSTFDEQIAGLRRGFRTVAGAWQAGARWASRNGLVLLNPTPFSDTGGIAVTDAYATANHLRTIADLRTVAVSMTIGGPQQFATDPPGLEQIAEVYRVTPAAFRPLAIGDQYAALDAGTVQAADVQTTDGQLATGDYVVLRDPAHIFGFGNVVPVVTQRALTLEGPAFADTIERVDATLTTAVMRELNQLVDVAQQSPAAVAHQYLETHGLLVPEPY